MSRGMNLPVLRARRPLALALALACALTACASSDGASIETGDSGTEPEPDAARPDSGIDAARPGWGTHSDVAALFEANCSRCHGTGWASCAGDHEMATTLTDAIANGFMP